MASSDYVFFLFPDLCLTESDSLAPGSAGRTARHLRSNLDKDLGAVPRLFHKAVPKGLRRTKNTQSIYNA